MDEFCLVWHKELQIFINCHNIKQIQKQEGKNMRGAFDSIRQPTEDKRTESLKIALHNMVFQTNDPAPSSSEVHLRKNREGFDWCIQLNAATSEQEGRIIGIKVMLHGKAGIAITKDGDKGARYEFYFNNSAVPHIHAALQPPAPKAEHGMALNVW